MFKHIHIVACSPRSGTTLLHEAMVTCFKVDKHYDHEIRFNLVSAKDEQILVTKRPKDTMYMPSVIEDDPELFVIYVMRDPRDVIVSRHGKNKDMYYSNIRLWREMHNYAKQMSGHERFIEVRYEDFVTDPDATQRAIAQKFRWLQQVHNFSEYHEFAQVSEKSQTAMRGVRPIAPTSVGIWTKYPGRVKGQQEIHGSLTPDLIECGYESSNEWEHVLKSVEPDLSRSRYPEKVYFWSRISQYINALRKVAMYRRKRRATPEPRMSGFRESVMSLFYRVAVSGALPVAWFRDVDPATVDKAKKTGKLKLEIVSHCWRYGHFLTYQLSSLVNHRTDKFDITMTVFHVPGDEVVTRVLDYFGRMEVPGVTWNWQALTREQLFRRGIGRNLAAKNTDADWIWFTDADIIFHEDCLDTLADLLQGRDDGLVHPKIGLGTSLLAEDDEILDKGREGPSLLEIPIDRFRPYGGPRKKAKGPHQITHGDVARACGYCDSIKYYQTPAERWMKTYEDRAFRWLIGTHGTPLDIPNVCQIRHIVKGRYNKDSFFTKVRKFIRKSQDQ